MQADGGTAEGQRVVHMGLFVERVSWTFKWTELIRTDGTLSGPTRLRFQVPHSMD